MRSDIVPGETENCRLRARLAFRVRHAVTILFRIFLITEREIGHFAERLVAIDTDRSKLLVAFAPADPALLRQIVAGIDTKYDPASLMRVVMIEHARPARYFCVRR